MVKSHAHRTKPNTGGKAGGHAYWSGQIKIALVYLPVNVFTATKTSAKIALEQVDRNTGEHIHHANVLENGTLVPYEDIIKGYKNDDGSYTLLEKDELDTVKLPSSDVLELTHFVDFADLPFIYFEKPLYIMPKGKSAAEVYTTIRDALKDSNKVGIGQLTVRGREELCAVLPHGNGLVLELLRYGDELKDPDDFFAEFKDSKTKKDNLKLAQALIAQQDSDMNLNDYADHYHDALLELIESKRHKRQPHFEKAAAKPRNVVNFMDALRKSLNTGAAPKKAAAKTKTHKPAKRRRA